MPAYHGHRVVVHAVVPLRYQPVLPLAHDAQAGTQRSRRGLSHGQPRVAHRRPQVAEHLADVHEEQRRSVLCELGDYQARCVPVARGPARNPRSARVPRSVRPQRDAAEDGRERRRQLDSRALCGDRSALAMCPYV